MHRVTPNWTWTLNSQKYSIYTKDLPQRPKFWVRFTLCVAVSEIQCQQNMEMHRMTPNWTWTFDSQKYTVYMTYLPLGPKFWSVFLYDLPFPRCNMNKVGEKRKCTEWPQTELEHLTVKSTLYTLNTYLWGSNFGPIRSTISLFRDTTCITCWS